MSLYIGIVPFVFENFDVLVYLWNVRLKEFIHFEVDRNICKRIFQIGEILYWRIMSNFNTEVYHFCENIVNKVMNDHLISKNFRIKLYFIHSTLNENYSFSIKTNSTFLLMLHDLKLNISHVYFFGCMIHLV